MHVLTEFDGGRSIIACTEREDEMHLLSENDPDTNCHVRAKQRGQETFTLVEQDITAVRTIAHWIYENIEQASEEKLRTALEACLRMRKFPNRKIPGIPRPKE